jgi:predicted amidophosphoribosyltransferase
MLEPARGLARTTREPARALAGDRGFDAVAFVPATRRSVHERGFNPAEELARPIANGMKAPLRRLLTKTRDTADQAGLGPAQRRANLAGAFEAKAAPRRVLLVDDIFTTGATADACAAALIAAGATTVDVVTFARAGRARLPKAEARG